MDIKNLRPLIEKQEKRKEIKKWLRDNDWIINKVFLGEWEKDDERFLSYKTSRNQKRQELDIVENEIKFLRVELGIDEKGSEL